LYLEPLLSLRCLKSLIVHEGHGSLHRIYKLITRFMERHPIPSGSRWQIALTVLVVALGLSLAPVFAVVGVAVTPATGGSAISAATVGVSYTNLTGPTIVESVVGQIGTGTIVLNAPTGFAFKTVPSSVTATRTNSGNCNGNGNSSVLLNTANSQTVTPTASTITITVTQASAGNQNNCKATITWSGIAVQPTAVSPLATGNITESGTSTISGITGSTNFGTLTEVAVAPTLTLINHLDNTNGGTADPNAWTLTATGPVTLQGHTGVTSDGTFQVGTYVLSESNGPNGYVDSGWVCIGGSQTSNSITLISGQSATCTVTNTFTSHGHSGLTDQTITFDPLSNKTIGDADFTVSATATSGLTVSFGTSTSGVCTVSGSTVHLVSAGTCTIIASQTGDATYNAAPDVSRSFTVNVVSSTSPTPTPDPTPVVVGVSHRSGTVVIQKVLVGGPKTYSDFTFDLSGSLDRFNADGVNTYTRFASTLTVTETPTENYVVTYGGDCTAAGTVTVNVGTTVTCMVTNTYNGPAFTPSPTPAVTPTTSGGGTEPTPTPTPSESPTPTPEISVSPTPAPELGIGGAIPDGSEPTPTPSRRPVPSRRANVPGSGSGTVLDSDGGSTPTPSVSPEATPTEDQLAALGLAGGFSDFFGSWWMWIILVLLLLIALYWFLWRKRQN
jgi:hypothetical protein